MNYAGDPCNSHDLVRVAAHKATSVVIMMTDVDAAEADEEGAIINSATIRTVLALRNTVYSNGGPALANKLFKKDLRVVVHLSGTCPFISGASFLAPAGHECLYPQDITKYINSMLFHCAVKPSLSRVLMSLVDFQGPSMRTRPPTQLRAGKSNKLGWFIGKTMREAMLNSCWGNGILIGYDDEGENNEHPSDGSLGVMCDPDHVIEKSDHMIFVSPTSSPSSSCFKDFSKEAEKYISNATRNSGSSDPIKMVPAHILICGWRDVWDTNPERFRDRFNDMISYLNVKEGSSITTINPKTVDEMDELLGAEGLGFRRFNGGWTTDDKVTVLHIPGDPTAMEDMQPIIQNKHYHTAICLGTLVNQNLSAECSDSRVLGTLLILRVLCERKGQFMHCVAENAQDQTSQMFLGPRSCPGEEADFINTQAIIAR